MSYILIAVAFLVIGLVVGYVGGAYYALNSKKELFQRAFKNVLKEQGYEWRGAKIQPIDVQVRGDEDEAMALVEEIIRRTRAT